MTDATRRDLGELLALLQTLPLHALLRQRARIRGNLFITGELRRQRGDLPRVGACPPSSAT